MPKKTPKILVVGDLMVDIYMYGKCTKISPEAPVPVVSIKEEKKLLGGASNVAFNLQKLGANVEVLSVLGDDEWADFIFFEFKKLKITPKIIRQKSRQTSVKTRILGGFNQIVRIDKESTEYIDENTQNELFLMIKNEKYNAIIFSDYDKGVLGKWLCKNIITNFNCPILADPKKDFYKFRSCTLLTPNLKEASVFCGEINEDDYKKSLKFMQEKLNLKYPLITLSEKGMVFLNENQLYLQSAKAKEVYDVTGAGDSVIATLGYFLGIGENIIKAVDFANRAAAIVVGRVGVSAARLDEIINYEDDEKVKNKNELCKILSNKKNIVFTNGCFDLVHIGHIKYLKYAKSLGDVLVVGLNSDRSVKKLKGENRPINNEKARAQMLSAFEFVDYVCIFDEDTPFELIKSIKPDILVKGGDYKIDEVVGKEYAKKVVLADFIKGYSTSKTIEKIKNQKEIM